MVEKKAFQRLSKAVLPTNYKIKFQPNLETFKFSGEETVDVEVKRAEVSRITVNCVDIDILSVKFVGSDEIELEPSKIVYKAERETVTFLFPSELPVGPAKLNIVFNGELNDKLKGFYRSKYKTACGEERYSAVTQFESTHARNAFPCWDEPALKATFEVTMVAPKDRVVLSNMDVDSEEHECGDLQVVHFKKTPIMSTYLLAFVVGEYDFIEDTTSNGVLVRVYTPVGKAEQGRFALEIAVKTLPFYTEYFHIAYPLPKLDLIAIPDFDAGAMENWGLVTYRETCLLIDEVESSAQKRQRVALVVGHELAHQWFGNLTTMEWWTHLWLNEGFASWVEYLCVDHCCPQYNIWTQFVESTMTPALKLDALGNSHPIEVPVGHPSEIDEIFDAISYDKGASIIQMLHSYIGTKDFKAGMHSYLTEFQYKNACTEDLWRHLEKESKKPVTDVMSTWTKQMGYPVLMVSCERTSTQTILQINQKKFNADGSEDINKSLWAIPITLTTGKDPSVAAFSTLLNEPDMVVYLGSCANDTWIKLNPGQVGFYRTLYSAQMLEELIPGIKKLSAVDRLGIENDLFAAAVAGYTSTVDFLKLLCGYAEETDYIVWSDLLCNLSQLGIIMQCTDVFDNYKEFIMKLCKPALKHLGMQPTEDEGHTVSLLRSLLLSRLGRYGDPEVVEECQRQFKAHMEGTAIHADIRSAVYCTVATHGDVHTIDQLMTLYRNTTHQEEMMRVGTCLGMNEHPDVITKVLNFALSDEVRNQDTIHVMAGCTASLIGRRMTWEFTKDKWDVLYDRYNSGFLIMGLIRVTTKYFATKSDYYDIKAFFEEHQVDAAVRTINQSLESIELNRKWLERDHDGIVEWLSNR